jgi:hypothetical protein
MPAGNPARFVHRYAEPLLRLVRGLLGPKVAFDAAFYRRQYPDVARGRIPPLWHYLMWGAIEGRYPRSPFGTAGSEGRPARLSFRPAPARAAIEWKNAPPGPVVPVFVVYEPADAERVRRLLIPTLAAQELPVRLALDLVNRQDNAAAAEWRGALESITDWSARREPGRIGFAAAVKFLFEAVRPDACFFLASPAAIPSPGCLARLLATFTERHHAILGAREWPRRHPEEFEPETGDTCWASLALGLVSAEAFGRLGGFDPVYSSRLAEVDLSWRAWLEGMPVGHEPGAAYYLAGGADRRSAEDYASARDFLTLAYKFFGPLGEEAAREWLGRSGRPAAFERAVIEAFEARRPGIARLDPASGARPEMIRISGWQRFAAAPEEAPVG